MSETIRVVCVLELPITTDGAIRAEFHPIDLARVLSSPVVRESQGTWEAHGVMLDETTNAVEDMIATVKRVDAARAAHADAKKLMQAIAARMHRA